MPKPLVLGAVLLLVVGIAAGAYALLAAVVPAAIIFVGVGYSDQVIGEG